MANKKIEELIILKDLRKIKTLIHAISHPIRQDIMTLLADGDVIVGDIYKKLRLEQAVCSQQLAILRRADVVKVGREGKHRPYTLNKEYIKQVSDYITKMAEIAP